MTIQEQRPRLFRDISKGAVTVVVIEDALAVLSDVNVRKAIAIVIANRYALPVAPGRDSGFLGDIGEGSVTIVAVERIAQRWIGLEKSHLPLLTR